MKKILAIMAVCSLAAIGCDDKKSTGGKTTNAEKGGTWVQTNTVRSDVTNRVTNTVVVNTAVETRTATVGNTVTVPGTTKPTGPGLPDGPGKTDPKKNGGN